ncbi:hypothetical protein Oweho_3268 [Owenweeksia hongkongensis DSM 17368]|uniref:PKD domain-containing protein n=1 Tax=Owenweeksia hongkongensis (strain DSM 17368 / CIP 108786 / JCM 12287 / NRRL B-23963 / UST20020801) TaxID=926562 RepID=G8R4B9_OWEHD|nr:T9SS type A sorting domain-containing protein [Owenweeksia hongkongensis]AEV34219.1 hypothetical protein Oweho_3268 [Owenweeksia hongkongensis DSM 17368]
MLKKLLFFFTTFLMILPTLFAQWNWGVRGGSVNTMQRLQDYNNITQIVTDANGNIYTMGPIGGAGVKVGSQSLTSYSGYGTGSTTDILICSFSPSGQLRWTKVIGGAEMDVVQGIETDLQGNVYLQGRVLNVYETWVGVPPTAVHFDADTVLSIVPIDSTTLMYKDTLQQSMFMIKYDTSGTLKWLRMPEPDSTSMYRGNFPFRMDVDNSGNVHWWCYLKPGQFRWANNNVITQEGMFILKYSTQGQVLSCTSLDMTIDGLQFWGAFGSAKFKVNSATGNYYIAGTNEGSATISLGGGPVNSKMYLAAFSPAGQLLWKKESGGGDLGSIEDLELDLNGNIYLGGLVRPGTEFGGHTYTSPKSSGAPFVSSFDSGGNHLWSEMAVVDAVSITYDVAVSDTEIAITGYGSSLYWPNNTDSVKTLGNQGYDAFLARFNKSNGELITMERTNTPFGGASYGNAIAAGPQNTYYMGGNFSMSMFLGQDTLYKVGSQRSFFLTKYECDVPEASMSVSGINASNTINLTYTGDPADSVKWYLGDGTQVWGDSIQHSYAAKGKYRVCAMAYFECTEVTVCDSLVAGEISLIEESLAEIAIYPNPTNDFLNLENLSKEGQVTLYNLSGKLLLQQPFKKENNKLDLSDLPKGVYVLELISRQGVRVFRKVMKE